MTITSGLLQAVMLFIAMISGTSDVSEILHCEIVELEEYGFEQSGEHTEYVCANPAEYTYFRVIEDVNEVLEVGDEMVLGIDANVETGDVLKAVRLP